jgi:polysaccharide pyruvyl transferase WcaK-like protein
LFGQHNLGNECTLQAIVDVIRRRLPDVKINCVCPGPENTLSVYDIASFSIRVTSKVRREHNSGIRRVLRMFLIGIPLELLHWVKAFKVLKGTRVFIAPGTGLLTDSGTDPLGRPYDLLKWSLLAKLRGCSLCFVSVGAGPIEHPVSRLFFKSALRLADYRAYRDNLSLECISRLGLDTKNDLVYPDLAFSLSAGMFPEPNGNHRSRKRRVVGVGVMDNYGSRKASRENDEIYQEYLRKTAAFVAWLLGKDLAVRILIGDGSHDIKPCDDLRTLLAHQGVNSEDAIQCNVPQSVEELIAQLACVDVIVSPRFHSILLGLILAKPVISLSYHEKNTALMASFGLRKYCQDIRTFDLGTLMQQCSSLLETVDFPQSTRRRRIDRLRLSLDRQYADVFKKVTGVLDCK